MFHDPIKLMHEKYDPNHGNYWLARERKDTGKLPSFYRYNDNYTKPFFENTPLGASAFKTKNDLINCLSEWQKDPLEYIEKNYHLLQVNEVAQPYYELKLSEFYLRPEIKWKSRVNTFVYAKDDSIHRFNYNDKETYIKKFNELKTEALDYLYRRLIKELRKNRSFESIKLITSRINEHIETVMKTEIIL